MPLKEKKQIDRIHFIPGIFLDESLQAGLRASHPPVEEASHPPPWTRAQVSLGLRCCHLLGLTLVHFLQEIILLKLKVVVMRMQDPKAESQSSAKSNI